MNRFFSVLLGLLSPLAATAANLASGEWFIDSDPGRGAGTAFALPATPTATANVTIPPAPLNALAPGYHLLGIRLRDQAGEWGHVIWRGFHKEAEAPGPRLLAAGEWFLNADPGIGMGTAIPMAANPTATVAVSIPAATLNGLPPGYHLLGVRLRDDEGEWGPVVWRGIHKVEPPGPRLLAGGEWFIDDDPGAGQGTAMALPATVSGIVTPQIPVSVLTPLADGYHLLGVRTRDNVNRWGPVVWQGFHIDRSPALPPHLASVEYRILREGQVISTTTKPVTPPAASTTLMVDHGKTDLLLDAAHLLQAVPVDVLGRRGHAVYAAFSYKRYATAWQEQHFTATERSNAAVSGDAADPDKDGLSNAQERFFALNPRTAGDAALAGATIGGTGPAAPLTLGFRVPAGGTVGADGLYRTGTLRYTLRQNTNLGPWTAVPAAAITSWTLTDAGNGAAMLRLNIPPGAGGRQFFVLEGALQ